MWTTILDRMNFLSIIFEGEERFDHKKEKAHSMLIVVCEIPNANERGFSYFLSLLKTIDFPTFLLRFVYLSFLECCNFLDRISNNVVLQYIISQQLGRMSNDQ